VAFGGPAEVLELVQAERPMLAIDEDEIEVELPQNVDDKGSLERFCSASRSTNSAGRRSPPPGS
jgi:hypothetical protein